MHTCEEYRILVSALIDDEISAEERTALMTHLAECEDCKTYLSDQLLIHEAVQSMDCTAPVGFADGVMARVRETTQEKSEKKIIPSPHWKRFAGLAACCAVIVLGIYAMDGGNLSTESTSNCAAPQMAYSVTGAAQTVEDTDGAAETTAEVPAAGTAEAPEAATKSAAGATPPQAQSEENSGACVADSSDSYSEYAAIAEYAARITTSSDTAAQWVTETLGLEWTSGTYYLLTAEEYAALKDLLTDTGELFTEALGTKGSELYQLLAE